MFVNRTGDVDVGMDRHSFLDPTALHSHRPFTQKRIGVLKMDPFALEETDTWLLGERAAEEWC